MPQQRRKARKMVDPTVQPQSRLDRLAAVAAHPLAELLDCPRDAGGLLTEATKTLDYEAGQVVFRQNGQSKGLYVVIAGEFVRKAERLQMRVTLGTARPGDLLELAAALGNGQHTYTLNAVSSGSMLLLPIEALRSAFENYPPLRMRLLEELAREVSRAYITCSLSRVIPTRRHAGVAHAY